VHNPQASQLSGLLADKYKNFGNDLDQQKKKLWKGFKEFF